jgi:hypothetical protein
VRFPTRAPGIALALAAVVGLALALPSRWPLLVLPPLVLFPRYARDVAAGRLGDAARAALLWAALLSALTLATTCVAPDRMAVRVFHGPAYRDEMLAWIRTGEGKEGDIARFLPEHIAHLALLLAASFATGGAAGLLLGTFLLNYMNFYVASLILESARPAFSAVIGWPIWSVVRVVGFVLAATAVAAPAHHRFRGAGSLLARSRRLLGAGLALAGLDILLKYALASHWRLLLKFGLGE